MAWALIDQGISSLTNYLLLVLIIRTSSIAEVGSYGLAYTSYFLAQSANRAISVDPLTVRTSTENRVEWRQDCGRALAAAVTTSLLLAVLSAGCSLLLGGDLGTAFLSLSVGLPFLLTQDTFRGMLFADRRIRAAAANDSLFLVAQATIYAGLFITQNVEPVLLLLGWAFGAAIGTFAGFVQLQATPSLTSQRTWLRDNRSLIPGYLADYLANRGAEQATIAVIFSLASPATAGVVVAARTLFAPITTIQTGIKSYSLPLASRLYRGGQRRRLGRFIFVFGIAMLVLMLFAGVVLELMPDLVGRAVFGSNWESASTALWPMALFSGVNATGFAVWVGCKATGHAAATFLGRLLPGATMIGLAAVGVVVGGANGAILGMTAGAIVLVAAMILVLKSGMQASGDG